MNKLCPNGMERIKFAALKKKEKEKSSTSAVKTAEELLLSNSSTAPVLQEKMARHSQQEHLEAKCENEMTERRAKYVTGKPFLGNN